MHAYNHAGRFRLFDFGTLTIAEPMQRSLARLFAERSHGWTSHQTARQYWMALEVFARFVDSQSSALTDIDDLTPALMRQYREKEMKSASGRFRLQRVKGLLAEDTRLSSGPIADELARRVKKMESRAQSFTETEFDKVKQIARQDFRAALLRIEENGRLLELWRSGALPQGSRQWRLGQILDILARTGHVPRHRRPNGHYRPKNSRLLGGEGPRCTWGRLFLQRRELISLGVLLMAEYGWNLSVIDRARAPQAHPDQGIDGAITYTIPVEKRKRGGGRWFSEENVTDDGADSKGRLVTEALSATRFARNLVAELSPGTDLLMVAHCKHAKPVPLAHDADRQPPVGPFVFGIHGNDAYAWARSKGLQGAPFRRGRRTVTVETRQPMQHSRATNDRHYVLPDPRTRQEATERFAEGATAAHTQAVQFIAKLAEQPTPTDTQTATADCSGTEASPWPDGEGDCRASFLLCLACPQARVHPGHHPRLAHLQEQLSSLEFTSHGDKWHEHFLRLQDLERKVGEAIWTEARSRVSDIDRAIVEHLLNGDFNP
ncbi:hypothetical protein ACFYY3_27575 [Streptomyces sp. NPDC001812]|uniref:hypothetical protein n=1 Tax=Streptomyces sp. NPDC001812 TaxID=3364611 RepID=UPI0036995269